MRLKKAMAILLTVSTVLSSQAFATSVYGSVTSGDEISVEAVTGTEDESKEEVIDASKIEEKEDSTINESKEKSDVAQKDTTSEKTSEDEKTTEEIKDSTEELTDETAATVDEIAEESDVAESEVEDADIDEKEKVEAAEKDELLLDDAEKAQSVDDEGNVIEAADDYFDRTKTTLTMKEGAVLAPVVTVPREVTTIPNNIFKNNSIVKEIKFESNSALEKIDADAFRNSGLESIIIPANKDGNTIEIGESAFKGSKLREIIFRNDTLDEVKDYAFASTNISSISLGACTKVGENAFANCVYLENISIPNLKTIGASAFEGCTSFNDWMNVPASVEAIGSSAFRGCGLTNVNLSLQPKLVCMGQSTDIAKYDDNVYSTMGVAIFANNTRLTTVSLASAGNDKFQYLPARTFEGCTALKYVMIHDELKVVGDNAFENCTSLKEIDLVNTQYVNSEAFKGCSALAKVTMSYKDIDSEGNERTHVVIKKNAFPDKTGVTLRAYDSFVREYADDMAGYKFESLYKNNITIFAPASMKPTLSAINPNPGDEVIITVPTNKSTFLTEIYYTYENGTGTQTYPKYLGEEGGKLKFSFIMPDKNVALTLRDATAAQLKSSSFTVGFEGGTVPETKATRTFSWEKTGCSSTLKMKSGMATQDTNWLYTFKSANENVVTVTEEGVVAGISNDSTQITITPKYNTGSPMTITLVVGGDVRIGQIFTGQNYTETADTYSPQELISVGPAGAVSVDPETGYPVVTFNKNMVAKANQTINVDIKAYQYKNTSDFSQGFLNAKNNNSSTVKSFWSVTDSAITTISKKTSTDNKNVITVKKGSSGESLVSVYTLYKDEKTPNSHKDDAAYADRIGHIIVRVADITPRLVETTLNVNHQLEAGEPITVVPVYGYEILDDKGLYIAKKKTVNGIPEYYADKDTAKFEIEDGNDGHWYVKTTDAVTVPLNKTEVYKKNTLYLCGYYKDTDKGAFQIPLPQVTISNTVPKPKVTQSGTINLFYNGKAKDKELGKVTITQSLTNLTVKKYELVSVQNYKINNSETNDGKDKMRKPVAPKSGETVEVSYDSLGYNFDIFTDTDSVNNSKAVITRSSVNDDLAVVNKKTVVAGYLYIYYEGYKTPSKVAITINNKNTAPTYLLNMTSATAHVNETNQEYKLWLYEKGTSSAENNRIDLEPTYNNGGDLSKNVIFDVEKTKGNFTLSGLQSTSALDEDYLMLKVNQGSSAKAGKSVIKLHMSTWSNPSYYMTFNFELKSTDKIGTKLSASKKTLNRAWVYVGNKGEGDKQEIAVTSTINDAYIAKVSDFVGAKNNAAYKTLEGLLDSELANKDDIKNNPAKIIINQPTGADIDLAKAVASGIPNGTYTFTATPYAQFYHNESESGIKLSPVKFSIAVVNNVPTISVGAMTFNTYANVLSEAPTAAAKIGNIIDGTVQEDYKLNSENAQYDKLNSKNAVIDTRDQEYFENHIVNLDYDDEKFTNPVKGTKKDTYSASKWKVTKMQVVSPNGCVADAKAYNLEFKANTKQPTVSVKASGGLNMIRPLDQIRYVSTVNNVKGNITGVGIREIDANSKAYIKSRFKITNVGSTVFLSVDPDYEGEELVPNKTYRVALCYSIDSMYNAYGKGEEVTHENADAITYVDVKPTVAFPNVTVTTSKAYAYAGQNKQNANWYITVTAQVDSAYRGYYDENGDGKYDAGDTPYINVAGVDWASSMTKAYKNEFEIIKVDGKNDYRYDPVTGKITFRYKLKNASEQLQNKKYTLSFTTQFKELQVEKPVNGKNYNTTITVNK